MNQELQIRLIAVALLAQQRVTRLNQYRRYNRSDKAKVVRDRYEKTDKSKARIKRYSSSKKATLRFRRYESTPKAKLRKIRYYLTHTEELRLAAKNYRSVNWHAIRERQKPSKRAYNAKRWHADPLHKLKKTLRLRIRQSMKSRRPDQRAMLLLGCTIEEFRRHIESLFTPGMAWDNFGRGGWSLDHIRPIDSFDLSEPDQVKICFHYSNHQPLWEADNIRKSNKILPEAGSGKQRALSPDGSPNNPAPANLLTRRA